MASNKTTPPTEQNEKELYLSKTDNAQAFENIMKAVSDHLEGKEKEVWPSGFGKLDDALDGGFFGSQLCVLGAVSSLGKTSFTLQMASQMAEQGKDVLIFSLEMSKEELLAKYISRVSYESSGPDATDKKRYPNNDPFADEERFTTRDVLKGNVGIEGTARYDAFENAFEHVKATSENLHIYVGNNDVSMDQVEQVVRNHIEVTGKRPAVIIDYLQILSSSEEAIKKHYDLRRSTNDDITRLKILARNNDIPIIIISALNRASYTDPVSMVSYRESSGIEYSSDILIGLQYQGMDYEKKTISRGKNGTIVSVESEAEHFSRVGKLFEDMQKIALDGGSQPIELKILKNRNGSRQTLDFYFVPRYNYFYDEEIICLQTSNDDEDDLPFNDPHVIKKDL